MLYPSSESLGSSLPWREHASVASILQLARQNADMILEEARNNQSSIAQALKMNQVGDSTGQEDDCMLEDLRWFVYPKECATWLSQGYVVPPETESPQVLGALQPRAVHLDNLSFGSVPIPPKVQSSPSCQRSLTTIIDAPSRKRKSDAKAVNFEATIEPFPGTPVVTPQDQSMPFLATFRDGEHSGEASTLEIESGFNDGELSEQCMIYDKNSDSWVPIQEFLQFIKKGRSEVPNPTSTPNTLSVLGMVTSRKDEKNQKKKPARDSSQWGKNEFLSVNASTAPADLKGEFLPSDSIAEVPAALKCKKGKGVKPPPKLMRLITQALVQWNMVEDGDRLLLGLSGGKDSISLLHCLLEFQRKLPVKFELEVCTIDPMTPSFDPSPLIPYVESLGLKYHYIRDDIVNRANKSGRDGNTVSSLCAFCARMKRGNLYTCARNNNCNKLVLAQHLDDCAESFLMSVMHNGFLRTMKANYKINAGDISVIRPMVYCRESLMTEFVKAANLPVINENCPACFEEPKERARVKKLLTREETLFPNFYDNIRRSLIPLMHEDSTAILRCYTEEAVARSRKVNRPKIKLANGSQKVSDATVEEKKDDVVSKEGKSPSPLHEDEEESHTKRMKVVLTDASEDELIQELARRRAERFRLSGSMKRLHHNGYDGELPEDPTGQVCSLNGDNHCTIPCHELME